ncbi:MAG: ATP-binding cassette domain-containing protein, partial [Planctomycetota bacterium]
VLAHERVHPPAVERDAHVGRVHALMGENGAGKSTLGKTIAGLIRPDTGTVLVDGRPLKLGSIDDAFGAGVRIVHQELAQCPNLSVAENLCLHALPRGRIGIDRPEMARRAAALVHRIDPGIDVEAPLGLLAPGRRQICQIAASLDDRSATGGSSPRMIVFDEPTSSLSVAEAETLMGVIRQLAADGLAIVYVSHRMGEIFACCDDVTVLRDGKFVATNTVADIDEATLVEQMIGRRIVTPKTGEHRTPGGEAAALRSLANGATRSDAPGHDAADLTATPLLTVTSLSSPGKLRDVSLEVRPGEVLGVGGLVGAGRSELLDAIFGLDPRAAGTIDIAGNEAPGRDCRWMIKNGVGYVPEDRRLQGLFFQLGVGENIVVPSCPGSPRSHGERSAQSAHSLASACESSRSRPQAPRARPESSPGATSRSCSSRDGWAKTHACSCSMSPRGASTWARKPRSTSPSAPRRLRAPPCCLCRARCPSCSRSRIASS